MYSRSSGLTTVNTTSAPSRAALSSTGRTPSRVRTRDGVRPVLESAARDGALVVFTVVSPELREYIHALSYELTVEAVDLIGSLIGKLAAFLERQPINMPSGMLPLSEEYFRRIEAVEFAVKSDDGKE